MLYSCNTRSSRAYHYDTMRRAHNSFLTRCIGWKKKNSTDQSIFNLDTLIKTGSESTETIMRRKRVLFAGFVACIEETKLPKSVIFVALMGGAGLRGGAGKRVDGASSGRPREISVLTPTSG